MPARRSATPLAALVIILLAFSLRLLLIDGQSFWSDEGNSAALATRSLTRIAEDAALDIHPPLYYWLLHGWTRVLGHSELAMRSLSAFLATLLVAFGYAIARRLFVALTAPFTALLLALNPFQVYYAQEARMYTLAALLGAAVVLTMLHLYNEERTSGVSTASQLWPVSVVYVLIAVAGLYTHYIFAAMLLIVNIVYLLWMTLSASKRPLFRGIARWSILQILVFLAFLPWLRIMLDRIGGWPAIPQPYEWYQALVQSLYQLAFGHIRAADASLWIIPFVALLAGGALIPPRGEAEDTPFTHRHYWPRQMLILVWLLLPVFVMFIGGLFKEAYLKFLIIASLPFCMLLARALAASVTGLASLLTGLPSKSTELSSGGHKLQILLISLILPAGLAVLSSSALSLRAYYFDAAQARDDYRSIAEFIGVTASPSDAVILNAPGQIDVWEYYDSGDLPVYALPKSRPLDVEETVSTLQDLSDQHRYLYGVFWATDESDPKRVIETWLDSNAFKAVDVWRGNVRLVTYATKGFSESSMVARDLGIRFGEDILLERMELSDTSLMPGEILQVKLAWFAQALIQQRYKVTLQLLDDRGQVMAQRDAEPVGESRPTNQWAQGDIVDDLHGLFIPLATPPGSSRLIVALYDAESGTRLITETGSDYVDLATVEVSKPSVSPPPGVLPMTYRMALDFGDITLIGNSRHKRGYSHAPDTELRAGDLLHLTLYWHADDAPAGDWSMMLALGDGQAVLNTDLVGSNYGTALWSPGEIVRGEHDMLLPESIAPGRYDLQLSLVNPAGTASSPRRIGTVRVH